MRETQTESEAIAPAPPRPIPPHPPRRPRELEDGLNYWLYHPLAWRLARLLARTPLTPNMVSVLGGGCVVAAGVAYAQPGWHPLADASHWHLLAAAGHWPLAALAGLLLHMGWHVVDGADGDLARLTGRASPIGEMVDGICDYASHIVLYLILGWLLAAQIGGWAWPLMLAAGAGHVVQANHVEAWRRAYQWWVYDKPWLGQPQAGDAAARPRGPGGALVAGYLALANAVSAGIGRIDAVMIAAATDKPLRECLRIAALAEAPAILRPLWLLSPNPRTLVLGASMLAGSPLWYFLWQAVVLNLLLLRSIRRHEATAARVLARCHAARAAG